VLADRRLLDDQAGGDLAVGPALREQEADVALPLGEAVQEICLPGRVRRMRGDPLDHAPGDRG
jgi:hypothetical protein